MQKQPNIRWSKNQQQRLSKNIQKFNAKITRLQNKHPEIADFLPERLSVKEQKQNIKTAKDLKFLENSINRFFKSDAIQPIESETGIKTTKWEVKDIQLKVNRINRERARELEEAAPSTEKGTMGTIKKNNLTPKGFNLDKIKKSDWKKFKETIEKQSKVNYNNEKHVIYKENYLKAIKTALGEHGNELYNFVEGLEPETIYNNLYNDPILDIQFVYDPLQTEVIANAALEHWKNAVNSE